MKIISWNVRGLGSQKKRSVIKDFLRSHQPDIVVLQESKVQVCDRRFMQSLWGVRHRRWVCLLSVVRFRNLDNTEWWLTAGV
ncbi:hypothetical protein CsSME_00038064 [Camellia sinensis var. sinensis]